MTVLEWWHTGLAALVVGFLLWLTLSRRNGQIGLPPFRRTTSDPPIRNACAVVSRTVDTERCLVTASRAISCGSHAVDLRFSWFTVRAFWDRVSSAHNPEAVDRFVVGQVNQEITEIGPGCSSSTRCWAPMTS